MINTFIERLNNINFSRYDKEIIKSKLKRGENIGGSMGIGWFCRITNSKTHKSIEKMFVVEENLQKAWKKYISYLKKLDYKFFKDDYMGHVKKGTQNFRIEVCGGTSDCRLYDVLT